MSPDCYYYVYPVMYRVVCVYCYLFALKLARFGLFSCYVLFLLDCNGCYVLPMHFKFNPKFV